MRIDDREREGGREGEGGEKDRGREVCPMGIQPRLGPSTLLAPGGRRVFTEDPYDVTGWPHLPAVDGGGGTSEAPGRQGG
jgi:hypothetical protein